MTSIGTRHRNRAWQGEAAGAAAAAARGGGGSDRVPAGQPADVSDPAAVRPHARAASGPPLRGRHLRHRAAGADARRHRLLLQGAHLLRHSLATSRLRNGASLGLRDAGVAEQPVSQTKVRDTGADRRPPGARRCGCPRLVREPGPAVGGLPPGGPRPRTCDELSGGGRRDIDAGGETGVREPHDELVDGDRRAAPGTRRRALQPHAHEEDTWFQHLAAAARAAGWTPPAGSG